MIQSLRIRNIVLIEHLSIDFHSGMQVLSGETGAGKSIVVDAVNLILGNRADRGLIRSGCEKASVEAVFSVAGNREAQAILDREGIEAVADDCIAKMKKFKKVYLTFDIDGLDPAYAGGTGTPQFGGLTSRMAMTLMQRLFTELNIIGFDVVEIAPPLDDSLASMYAGRKLITEAWGVWADEAGKLVKF